MAPPELPHAAAIEAKHLPAAPDVVAPDGSDVRVLLATERGSMAHFALGPGRTSRAVRHRTVDELWYFLSGVGELWRRSGDDERTVPVEPGVCISIRAGVSFQFRSAGEEALTAVAVTMPPWPGDGEAELVAGPWEPDP